MALVGKLICEEKQIVNEKQNAEKLFTFNDKVETNAKPFEMLQQQLENEPINYTEKLKGAKMLILIPPLDLLCVAVIRCQRWWKSSNILYRKLNAISLSAC